MLSSVCIHWIQNQSAHITCTIKNKEGCLHAAIRVFANDAEHCIFKSSATGTRTRVAWVRAEYPNQLDYSGVCIYIISLRYSSDGLLWNDRPDDRPTDQLADHFILRSSSAPCMPSQAPSSWGVTWGLDWHPETPRAFDSVIVAAGYNDCSKAQ